MKSFLETRDEIHASQNGAQKSFDEIWEEIHASQEWGKYPSEPVIRFVARNYYNKDRESIKILDFGCGARSHTWYLAKENFDTYAFDGSRSAVKKVRNRLEQENLHANLRVSDALELDYETEFFDCVIDNATIYANRYQNIVDMYKKIYEILKTGGKLFSVSFTSGTTGYGTGSEIEKNTFADITAGSLAGRGISHFYEEKELKTMVADIGFKNIVIDTLRFTDNGSVVEQFLLHAEK